MSHALVNSTVDDGVVEIKRAPCFERKFVPGVLFLLDLLYTPPRVVYSVTPLGETLRPLLDAMCKWGKSHSAAMALKKLEASEEEQ